MKKLARFVIVSILYVLTFILFYCFIPFITWVFGGSFLYIVQEPSYIIYGGIIISICLGGIFYNCFDKNFYPKN